MVVGAGGMQGSSGSSPYYHVVVQKLLLLRLSVDRGRLSLRS